MKKNRKKIIIGLIIIFIIIIIVIVLLMINNKQKYIDQIKQKDQQKTTYIDRSPIRQIMPYYDIMLYTKADLLKHNKMFIENGYKDIKEKYEKLEKGDVKSFYLMEGFSQDIIKRNLEIVENFLNEYDEKTIKEYNELEETPYNVVLTEDKYNYERDKGQSNLSIKIDMETLINKGMYYEAKAKIYKPVLVDAYFIDTLPIGTEINVEFPDEEEEYNVKFPKMIWKGKNILTYKNQKGIEKTVKLTLNRFGEYEFFIDDDLKAEILVDEDTVKIMKDAEVFKGKNHDKVAKERTYANIAELVGNKKNFLIQNTVKFTEFHFDDKGYITSLFSYEK